MKECRPPCYLLLSELTTFQMLRNPLEAEYYNEFINLASIMCCGRTKTNEVILNRLIDSRS